MTLLKLKKLLENNNVNKVTDVYGLPPKLVKLAKGFFAKPLTEMFHESFLTGCFPDKLKPGIVQRMHKGHSDVSFSNYRPISVLPLLKKAIIDLRLKKQSLTFNLT